MGISFSLHKRIPQQVLAIKGQLKFRLIHQFEIDLQIFLSFLEDVHLVLSPEGTAYLLGSWHYSCQLFVLNNVKKSS